MSKKTLRQFGFGAVGKNALISERATFYGASRITISDDVRIDDFTVLSAGNGGIHIGSNVHISTHVLIVGACRITLSDFSGIASRVSIYSSTDDFSGKALTGPTVPSKYTGVVSKDVFLGKHVIVGSGTVILPGCILEDGVAIGALSLVNTTCDAFGIYVGNPARRVKDRSRFLLNLESEYVAEKR
ncbi:acyltransferase [Parvibaculum sp.]|uniref:acyltransferase n=1 Tax=Parvibaculum sp. TaxID=2024848 RepID=UPI0025F13505|nr:acyltransferase [Parvibaculum sp.]